MSVLSRIEFRLDGKVALVTGGGTGIGRAIAETFADAGAKLVLAGRREAPLRETAEAAGGEDKAIWVAGDVTVGTDRGRFLDAAVKAFGGLDVLVNNAGGVTATGSLEKIEEEAWGRMFDVNVTAPVMLSREAMPLLRKRKGVILNISTGSSLRPVSGFGAYGASKAALNHASQVLALEAGPQVRVNVVCPGGVDTPIFETFLSPEKIPGIKERFAEMAPLGRLGQPDEIASVALFLCSDAAQFVTGAVVPVDGGLNLG